jgi:hypothetical protein
VLPAPNVPDRVAIYDKPPRQTTRSNHGIDARLSSTMTLTSLVPAVMADDGATQDLLLRGDVALSR